MAPVIADSAEPIKKHGRGRPRKGEERVKKVYVPTGRPRGRPKGSRNIKALESITTSISNSVSVATVSAVPPPSAAAPQANIATATPIPLPTSLSSTSAPAKSPALSATTANAAAAAAANRSVYVPTGRPRGRPRKDGLPPQQRKPFPSPTSSSPTSSTAAVAAMAVASPGNPAKRGRGRPRKVVQPSVGEAMGNDTLVNEAESGKLPFLLLDTFYTTTAGHG
ncbi:hypothetical protein HOO65_050554 [Ceratocystis lukuohia]|uniref:AT hook domain-containing protein n=1 Tax=Ceratocystis lukuohia TaxID=2019550 RepID=A0ABR4MGL2_9PEZI